MHFFETGLRWSERIFVSAAALMLMAIMLVATVDVLMRYIFNAPLAWSYDLISMYLMTGVFFFAVSDTLAKHGHVAVDLLHSRLSVRSRHAVEVPGYALALVVLVATAWLAWTETHDRYVGGDVIVGRFDWPTWISAMFAALGFTQLLLRVLYRLVGHALSTLTGASVIDLPPLSGQEEV